MFSFFFFKQKTAYEMRISDWSSDVCPSDLLAVELDLAHIGVGVGQPDRLDGETLAARQVQRRAVDEGTPDHILVRSRRDRIEAEAGEDQPRRHLAEVVIARQAVGGRLILAIDALPQPPLRPPRRPGIDIEIR